MRWWWKWQGSGNVVGLQPFSCAADDTALSWAVSEFVLESSVGAEAGEVLVEQKSGWN